MLLVVGALQACLETLNSGLGAVLLFLEVLVMREGGKVGGRKVLLDDGGNGLGVGGLREECELVRRGGGAGISDGRRGEHPRVYGVALTIGGRDLGLIGLKGVRDIRGNDEVPVGDGGVRDRKSTRLNSSHANISYAV